MGKIKNETVAENANNIQQAIDCIELAQTYIQQQAELYAKRQLYTGTLAQLKRNLNEIAKKLVAYAQN